MVCRKTRSSFIMIVLSKVLITVFVVSTLSIIAERVSPRAAGILSGYPLGSAISLFFIGYEQGADFAGAGALFNVAGLAALLVFFFVYYHVSARIHKRLAGIVVSSLAAILAFFAAGGLIMALNPPPWGCVLVAAAGILSFGALFRGIPDTTIANHIHLGYGVLLVRASLAALVILAVTGAAHILPPAWAGLFSAFPATVFPLVLILHSTYSAQHAHTVIKHLPSGLWSLMLYSMTIAFAYPRLGIYWGTLAGYAVATVYLLGLAFVLRRVPAEAG